MRSRESDSREVAAAPAGPELADPLADPSPGVPRSRPARAALRRRIVFTCAAIAAGLHTLAVLWTWLAWAPGPRGTWLVWLDLPVSLLYMHLVGRTLLPWSLLLGGLQWAATGALVAWLVGWVARRRPHPPTRR